MRRILSLCLSPALDCATRVARLCPDAKLRCSAPDYAPGGGGINVARAIHLLGGEAVAVFPAGGPSGQRLCRLLAAEGVAHQALAVSGWTRECLNVQELAGARQYRFVLPGTGLAAAEQEQLLAVLDGLAPFDYLVLSGSLPAGLAPDFLAQVWRLARRHGARCVLDSGAEALRQGLEAGGLLLIKPNLEELAALCAVDMLEPARLNSVARELVGGGGCEAVLVSLGAQGALLATADLLERIPAPPVTKVSSVGAGDSLLAGTLLKLAEGAGWAEAARYGIAAGSAAIMTEGTQLCRLADTERLFDWLQAHHPAR